MAVGNRVNLPPGCGGFTAADGRYDARPGTHVTVSDEHAARLRKSAHTSVGMISVGGGIVIGTKKGRRCDPCGGRVWQAWSLSCPRCGAPTEPE
jgi:hypothetical protein